MDEEIRRAERSDPTRAFLLKCRRDEVAVWHGRYSREAHRWDPANVVTRPDGTKTWITCATTGDKCGCAHVDEVYVGIIADWDGKLVGPFNFNVPKLM